MEYHKTSLANLCRICGYRALKHRELHQKKKAKLAVNYIELIKLLFGVNIERDIEAIHPKVLCSSCYYKLMDCRKKNKFKSLEKYEQERKLAVSWEAHSDELCRVCDGYSIQSQPGQYRCTDKHPMDVNTPNDNQPVTPVQKVRVEDVSSTGTFVSLNGSLASPLSKAEEKVHTSPTKRKLNFSADKGSVVCKTGGQVCYHA